MTMTLALVAALGTPAAATMRPPVPLPITVHVGRPMPRYLRTATGVFGGAAAAAWTSTYRALTRPPVVTSARVYWLGEANPTLRWIDGQPASVVVLGAAMDVAGVWAWNRFVGRKHPKIAAVGLYVASAFRLSLAARNTRNVQVLDARRVAAAAR